MTKSPELIAESVGGICTVTIHRPDKRNSLTPDILLRLASMLREMESGPARCVVLRGSGDKAFSSGYDISAIGKIENDMMRDYQDDHPLTLANRAIESHPAPVIAMINGYAFGAGLELALSCDIRICADTAILGMPPARLGVTYSYEGIRKFLNLIGLGYAKEMFLTGRSVDAPKAERMGLVNYIRPAAELEAFTYAMAREIEGNAPLSMSAMKGMINSWQRNQRPSEQDEEAIKALIGRVQESEDYREGQRAFAEKRKPRFTGS
ncbi:MAG: enoyl-CoA hydratase/isomerase family protein [Deltaproteobacteria bacterium]